MRGGRITSEEKSAISTYVGAGIAVLLGVIGIYFFFLTQKEKVNPDDGEQYSDAGTDVRTDRRFFFAGDSASMHRIVMNVIESAISGVRQDGIRFKFYFRISGRDWTEFQRVWGLQDIGLPRESRMLG